MEKHNASLRNLCLGCTGEACCIFSALNENFLIRISKVFFSFYLGFFYIRGDSGIHTSFISASLLHKSIHCIIFHFSAHLIYFSSRIQNSLTRRRAYQRKNKHKQQRPSPARHHRSLVLLLCYHFVFLTVLSLLLGRESTSGYKNKRLCLLRKAFLYQKFLCLFLSLLSSASYHLSNSGEGMPATVYWSIHNLQIVIFSRKDKLNKEY